MEKRIKFKYDRKEDGTPIKTSCVIMMEDNKEFVSGVIGYSVCSKKDNFNKKVGRAIALQRANKVLEVGTLVNSDGFLRGEVITEKPTWV